MEQHVRSSAKNSVTTRLLSCYQQTYRWYLNYLMHVTLFAKSQSFKTQRF